MRAYVGLYEYMREVLLVARPGQAALTTSLVSSIMMRALNESELGASVIDSITKVIHEEQE
jgi:hypothetical protein